MKLQKRILMKEMWVTWNLKITDLKMLTEARMAVHEWSENFSINRKCKKVPSRPRGWKYKNWTDKCNTELRRQTAPIARKGQCTRQGRTHPSMGAKEWRQLRVIWHVHRGPGGGPRRGPGLTQGNSGWTFPNLRERNRHPDRRSSDSQRRWRCVWRDLPWGML